MESRACFLLEEMVIQWRTQGYRRGVGEYTNYSNRHVPVAMSREISIRKLCGGTERMCSLVRSYVHVGENFKTKTE